MIVREQVIAAVRARLAAVPSIGATTLNSRFTVTPGAPLNIADQGHSIVETGAQTTTYSLALDLEFAVDGADDEAASTAFNAAYAAIIRALFGGVERLGLSFVDLVTEGALAPALSESADRAAIAFTLGIDIQFTASAIVPGVAP